MATASKQKSDFAEDFATVLLHRNEIKKKHRLHPEVIWMLEATVSSLFTPFNRDHEIRPLEKQSYQRWKVLFDTHKVSHPRRARRRNIVIQPLTYSLASTADYPMSQVEAPLLEWLSQFCSVYFSGMTLILNNSPSDLANNKKITSRVHHQTHRCQLLVDDIVKYIKSHLEVQSFCVVGVTLIDLYPGPKWNFTLGHASFSDGVAICSFGRHFNSHGSTHSQYRSTLYRQIGNLWVLLRVSPYEMMQILLLSLTPSVGH